MWSTGVMESRCGIVFVISSFIRIHGTQWWWNYGWRLVAYPGQNAFRTPFFHKAHHGANMKNPMIFLGASQEMFQTRRTRHSRSPQRNGQKPGQAYHEGCKIEWLQCSNRLRHECCKTLFLHRWREQKARGSSPGIFEKLAFHYVREWETVLF